MRIGLGMIAAGCAAAAGALMVVGIGLVSHLGADSTRGVAYRWLEVQGLVQCLEDGGGWPPRRWFVPADVGVPEQPLCVPVARRALPVGHSVKASDLSFVPMPRDYVPDDVILQDLGGRVVSAVILPGEMFRDRRLQ